MINDFHIGPFTGHMYGLMICIGILVALTVTLYRAGKQGLDKEVVWDLLYCVLIGGVVGCKLLYYIVELPEIIKDPSILLDLSGGWVIYGGIIGGFLVCLWYCRKKGIDVLAYFDLLLPAVSLAQGFGRIGCFFAGCCYGRVTESWFSITYTISKLAPNGVKLLPTQLISSAGDFIIFIVLILYATKKPKKGTVMASWMTLYSIGRFGVEFLRNDHRGNVGIFSTSQFISLGLFLIGIAVWYYLSKNKEMKEAE